MPDLLIARKRKRFAAVVTASGSPPTSDISLHRTN
jgi:hypothetical protein